MSGFLPLFWGYLVVLLDFRFNSFDILVDVIGFVIQIFAIAQLSQKKSVFSKAKPYLYALTVLSFFSLFSAPQQGMFDQSVSIKHLAPLIAEQLSALLLVFYLYWICWGIAESAADKGFDSIGKNAMLLWKWYAAISAVLLFVAPFSFNVTGSILSLIMLPLTIAGLVAAVCFLILFWKSHKVFSVE